MTTGLPSVSFQNSYGKLIWIAYMYRDLGCGSDCGDEWNVEGWINLQPGETQTRPNPTANRWFFFFAEAADGATWSSQQFSAEVRQEVFSKCTCLGVSAGGMNPYHLVGMETIDLQMESGVELIPG